MIFTYSGACLFSRLCFAIIGTKCYINDRHCVRCRASLTSRPAYPYLSKPLFLIVRHLDWLVIIDCRKRIFRPMRLGTWASVLHRMFAAHASMSNPPLLEEMIVFRRWILFSVACMTITIHSLNDRHYLKKTIDAASMKCVAVASMLLRRVVLPRQCSYVMVSLLVMILQRCWAMVHWPIPCSPLFLAPFEFYWLLLVIGGRSCPLCVLVRSSLLYDNGTCTCVYLCQLRRPYGTILRLYGCSAYCFL
jgi:hypothetical protein